MENKNAINHENRSGVIASLSRSARGVLGKTKRLLALISVTDHGRRGDVERS